MRGVAPREAMLQIRLPEVTPAEPPSFAVTARVLCRAHMSTPVRIVTVTVSDTRTAADDEGGRTLDAALRAAGFTVLRHHIVKDEPAYIGELINSLSETECEAVILTGGTGIAPRDQTYEAIERVLEKRMDGFGEAFRRLSWDEIGPNAILSRATAGVIHRTLVFALPGSVRAVRLGVEKLIIPILPHAADVATGRAVGRHGDDDGDDHDHHPASSRAR